MEQELVAFPNRTPPQAVPGVAGHDAGKDRQPGRIPELQRHDDEARHAPGVVGAENQLGNGDVRAPDVEHHDHHELGQQMPALESEARPAEARRSRSIAATATRAAPARTCPTDQPVQQQPHRQQQQRSGADRAGRGSSGRPLAGRAAAASGPGIVEVGLRRRACTARAVSSMYRITGPPLTVQAERQQQEETTTGSDLDREDAGERPHRPAPRRRECRHAHSASKAARPDSRTERRKGPGSGRPVMPAVAALAGRREEGCDQGQLGNEAQRRQADQQQRAGGEAGAEDGKRAGEARADLLGLLVALVTEAVGFGGDGECLAGASWPRSMSSTSRKNALSASVELTR